MAIPDDLTVQRELMELILRQPGMRILAADAYRVLSQLHPELSPDELTLPYQNSVSKWANRVQFARLHLVQRGWLYKANAGPSPEYGVWIATEAGAAQADDVLKTRRVRDLAPVIAADLDSRNEEEALEGELAFRLRAVYERDPGLRAQAIALHGTSCKGCSFDFLAAYGEHGRDYIEVHHLRPLADLQGAEMINAKTDMTVLCANCHRMVHRRKDAPLTLAALQALVRVHWVPGPSP